MHSGDGDGTRRASGIQLPALIQGRTAVRIRVAPDKEWRIHLRVVVDDRLAV